MGQLVARRSFGTGSYGLSGLMDRGGLMGGIAFVKCKNPVQNFHRASPEFVHTLKFYLISQRFLLNSSAV